jgi:hypothetical protein
LKAGIKQEISQRKQQLPLLFEQTEKVRWYLCEPTASVVNIVKTIYRPFNVRRYLEWEASVWEGRTEGWPDLRWDITVGVIAYARRQGHWRRVLLQSFSDKWDQSMMDAARAAALASVQTLSD